MTASAQLDAMVDWLLLGALVLFGLSMLAAGMSLFAHQRRHMTRPCALCQRPSWLLWPTVSECGLHRRLCLGCVRGFTDRTTAAAQRLGPSWLLGFLLMWRRWELRVELQYEEGGARVRIDVFDWWMAEWHPYSVRQAEAVGLANALQDLEDGVDRAPTWLAADSLRVYGRLRELPRHLWRPIHFALIDWAPGDVP